jgi:outer membrane receptor protein involved in Fe transport
MGELLRGESGVYFQQTGPGQGMAIVRGLKGSSVLHLVDGFRLNNAFFRAAPSQYIALLDAWNIDQLEVVRGPNSTLYGSDAMGGVIHVRTPEVRFQGEALQTAGEAKLHYASADEAQVGRVRLSVGNQKFSVTGGYTLASFGDRQIGGIGQSADGQGNIRFGESVGPGDYLSRAYDFKALWAVTPGDELSVSAQYFTVPELFRYNEMVPGSNPPPASRILAIYDNNRAFYQLTWKRSAPLSFMDSLEVHLGRQVINDNRFDNPSANPSRFDVENNRSTLDGLTLAAQSTLHPAHRLSYGIEWYQDRVNSAKMRSGNRGASFTSSSASTSFKSRFPNGASTNNYGLYVADAWAFAPSWLGHLGGRLNYTRTSLPAAPTSDRATAGEVENTDYSAQLGLRYALSPTLAWTGNLGRGYRAPNIFDLALVGDRGGNPARPFVANTSLKPESLISVDTGLKFRSGKAAGEFSVFYFDYQDQISTDNPTRVVPEGEMGCTDAGGCYLAENLPNAIYYGFEGSIRYPLLASLSARAMLNYTWAEKTLADGSKEPGNRIPPLNGEVALQWQALPKVTVEPSVWFNDSQHRLDSLDQTDARITKGGTPGFAVVNLAASWQATPEIWLRLSGENLLDKSYREHASGIDGRGRGVSLTASARLH